jgi:hypothetical protein
MVWSPVGGNHDSDAQLTSTSLITISGIPSRLLYLLPAINSGMERESYIHSPNMESRNKSNMEKLSRPRIPPVGAAGIAISRTPGEHNDDSLTTRKIRGGCTTCGMHVNETCGLR